MWYNASMPTYDLYDFLPMPCLALYTVKKVSSFPVPSRDVINQTLPVGNIIIIPGQGEFV
jgi:hypothetical protein